MDESAILIEDVRPSVDGGRYAVKREEGEALRVQADIFKEGHDTLRVVVRYRQESPEPTDWEELPLLPRGNDLFAGEFPLEKNGRYFFQVVAWVDAFGTWQEELRRKVAAGQAVQSELLEGAALLEAAASRADGKDAERLRHSAGLLRGPRETAVPAAQEAALAELALRHSERTRAARSKEFPVFADRKRAVFSTWYEFFPRSTGAPGTHGTFRTAEKRLAEISRLGFDVVYLPPIHPIGKTARKGKNNSLQADPEDPGSPWAIGAAEGGHREIHPALGSLADFRKFLETARGFGLEVALDLAFQCSPDHPYLKAHPEWFHHRPDGTIKTAENPPKRYEDIVNFDFWGRGREPLWRELLGVVLHWVEQGVHIFRVDNPHTKPLPFWEWLIHAVQDRHPEVIFLAEAFTRPKLMKALAKLGFSQSYTYFTWRNFRAELEAYFQELSTPPVADYFRGNLWPNTPDILPEILQRGGPPAFKLRLALAATLSPSYGIYSSYELCEGTPLHGEEYLDSEKYEFRYWNFERPGIQPLIQKLNALRKAHPALQRTDGLRFLPSSSAQVLTYLRQNPDGSDRLLVAVSLDPFSPVSAELELPLSELGLQAAENFHLHELLSDTRSLAQGETVSFSLTPENPAAIWRLLPFRRRESGFDYYG